MPGYVRELRPKTGKPSSTHVRRCEARRTPCSRPRPARAFRLRASNYSLLTLRLISGRAEEVLPALGDQFRRAPGFLRFAPIAIGLDDLAESEVEFPALVAGLRALEIMPIGVVGGTQPQRAAAAVAGLPALRPTGQKDSEVELASARPRPRPAARAAMRSRSAPPCRAPCW
jgi:septum site-determining protein MinC